MWAGLGGLGRLRYQKSEGGSMFSMARGLFPDSLTKICDLTNTPTIRHKSKVLQSQTLYNETYFHDGNEAYK